MSPESVPSTRNLQKKGGNTDKRNKKIEREVISKEKRVKEGKIKHILRRMVDVLGTPLSRRPTPGVSCVSPTGLNLLPTKTPGSPSFRLRLDTRSVDPYDRRRCVHRSTDHPFLSDVLTSHNFDGGILTKSLFCSVVYHSELNYPYPPLPPPLLSTCLP